MRDGAFSGAGGDEGGASHDGRELIHLVNRTIKERLADAGIAQVTEHEVVGVGIAELVLLKVYATDPVSLGLKPVYQMTSDEAAGSTYDRCLLAHHGLLEIGSASCRE